MCRTVDQAAEPGAGPLWQHGVPRGHLEARLFPELLVQPLDGLLRLTAPDQLYRSTKLYQHFIVDLT